MAKTGSSLFFNRRLPAGGEDWQIPLMGNSLLGYLFARLDGGSMGREAAESSVVMGGRAFPVRDVDRCEAGCGVSHVQENGQHQIEVAEG